MKGMFLTVALVIGVFWGGIIFTEEASAVTIIAVKVKEITLDDDKDKGESITLHIKNGSEILATHGPVANDITFHDDSEAFFYGGNPILFTKGFDMSSCRDVSLTVSKTGNKGWAAAFQVIGVASDGAEYEVLPRTERVMFGDRTPFFFSGISERGVRTKTFNFCP